MELANLRKKQILDFCKSCLEFYLDCLDEKELKIIKEVENKSLNDLEACLIPIANKIWDKELASGNYIIVSWNKFASVKEKSDITFATINRKDKIIPFCGLTRGVEYKITFDSLIGALNKDAATLIEPMNKKNEYTIGTIGDKVINSYNGATKLITPQQLVEDISNDYKSQHNELILKTDLIEEIGPFELENNFIRK